MVKKMRKILDIKRVHKQTTVSEKGTKSVFYKISIPGSVIERLELSYLSCVAFRKKANNVRLVRVTADPGETRRFMGIQKLGTRNRMCLPRQVVEFLNIADYVKFVEWRKNDIRIGKLNLSDHVPHHLLCPCPDVIAEREKKSGVK